MNKKNRIARIFALLLSCILLFSACASSKGETLMSLGNAKISVNMYRLWLSRVKGAYGGADDSVWQETNDDGRTYDEIFTEYVTQNAKTFLCALYEFDKLGLKLPDAEKEKIENTMNEILTERAGGSKSELNSMLANYGVNYNILKEIYTIEAKTAYLEEYLFGEGGTEKITDEQRDEYYKSEYVRIKQIFFYTANKPVTDSEGNYTYDDEGCVVTRDYTEEEIAEQKEKAALITASLTSGQDFDLLMAQSEDAASQSYPNGYYFTRSSQYVAEVVGAAFSLSEGEFTTVESEYGIHIIKRLPLDEKGYAAKTNADFFTDFEDNLRTGLFTARLVAYEDDIKINESLLRKYSVASSASNSYY